ncbi:trehalose-phosphatase [Brenneria izbisi]|uniref:Trehalose 6-phosphate phosphatase n=1 Tax=Brenneria izbisi TaxID=2939450 RepID=A0AA42C3V7_9GAMM|nr:trehalose-phosphatase [Brenneria izbisi]MCV9877659.1 trehalose-phosphatase [Brenneria izbisi]MCV9880776.1 trehalose-phosphatase [Brenneria izbisi]
MTTIATENTSEIPSPPVLGGGRYAFFFDVDGTLAEIQPEPEAVVIPGAVRNNLQALSVACYGALALVSGRPIDQLDKLIAPLRFPLAGVHGAERRDADGDLHRVMLPVEVTESLRRMLEHGMASMPDTLLEAKGMAFALHYRQARKYQRQVLALAQSAVARFPQLTLQPGKCVVEIKPRGIDKGAAIDAFMQEAPFAGRIPVFVGDDLTDERGFLAVNAMQGVSVKVGDGSGHARYRLKQVADVHGWLEQLLLQLKQDNVGKELRL